MDASNEIILYHPDKLMASTGSILELLQKEGLRILRRSIFSVVKDYLTVESDRHRLSNCTNTVCQVQGNTENVGSA